MKTIINPDDYAENFWGKNWEVILSELTAPVLINAEHEQAAIDYCIDWAEENAPGLLMEREEEQEEEYLEDYICGGNHGRYLSSLNVHIEQI